MLALSDLAATGLVENGARVSYRLQVAAPSPNDSARVDAFDASRMNRTLTVLLKYS